MVRRFVTIGLVAIGLVAALGPAHVHAQGAVTAFVDVSVVPMDRDRVLDGQTVLVRGDRIVELGPTDRVRAPAGATKIDGRGKFLMPGLADMHIHLERPKHAIEDRLFLYLANGVTTVREMTSDPEISALKRQIANGKLLGPRIYTARLLALDGSVEKIARDVADIRAGGYDFLKYYGAAPTREHFDSMIAVARRLHIPVVGHVSFPGIEPALQARVASVEHLWGYVTCVGFLPPAGWPPSCNRTTPRDTTLHATSDYDLDTLRLRELAVATRQAGTWNTPTLQIVGESRWRQWHQQIVKALSDAGAGLLLGTDIPNAMSTTPMLAGFSIHWELELLLAAGLSPYQALETGTRNAAVFLGTLDSAGTVAVGKRADLVLLDGNPLRDVRYLAAPAGVVVAGRWLARAEIDDSLRAMIRPDRPDAVKSDAPPLFGVTGFGKADRQRALSELMRDVRRSPAAP